MFNIFKREKWALVKSIKFAGYRSFYIHLFESEKGKRKAEYNYSGKNYNINSDEINFKGTDLYQLQLYRWLCGRRDVEIPRYDQIDEDDMAEILRGKK